jgi:hypothetical protein
MTSKDLDKLMGKLKKKEDPKEEIQEEEEEEEEEEDDIEDDDLEDDDNDDPIEDAPKRTNKSNSEHDLIANEVGLLQNDGIFRRELLALLKEQTNVLKGQAQTFIEIKKKLLE